MTGPRVRINGVRNQGNVNPKIRLGNELLKSTASIQSLLVRLANFILTLQWTSAALNS